MKYINADELFNQALAEEVDVGIYQEDGSYEGIYTAVLTSDLVKMANEMPSADVVEVKHGEWKDGSRNGFGGTFWYIYCSECLYERDDDNHDNNTPYCPNCGAEMRGTEDLADEINELIGEGFCI